MSFHTIFADIFSVIKLETLDRQFIEHSIKGRMFFRWKNLSSDVKQLYGGFRAQIKLCILTVFLDERGEKKSTHENFG